MGWFAKEKKKEKESEMDFDSVPDDKNPYTKGIEDEGELVTIVHRSNIVKEDIKEEMEEEQKSGSTNNRLSISQ